MPSTGGIVDSTIESMRPIDVIPNSRQPSAGVTTTATTIPDDGEIFKVESLYGYIWATDNKICILLSFPGIT